MLIGHNKKISLDRFIYKSLYDKDNGYYIKKNPFGKKGDFITSPNISVLFSEMISIWLISFWENLKKPKKINIIELCAGNVEMMSQIIKTLNNFKYAIHLNPNSIGGTFSLNCGYLGLPCIGNIDSNTQRLCFPDLSIEPDNLKKAKELAKKLRIDKDFYLHCSNTSKELYNKHFSEKSYNKTWQKILNQIKK